MIFNDRKKYVALKFFQRFTTNEKQKQRGIIYQIICKLLFLGFFNFLLKMVEKEDRFVASIAKLDGKPKFLHNSFKLGSDSLSQVSGKKLTTKSLLLSKEKERDFKKSYDSNIESKKKSDRISGPESNSIEGKKLKRKGAYEVNKEKVSDWDSTIQSRRLAKSYDFTNHKSSKPLATIGVYLQSI